jgi:hypothetical protein
MPAAQTKAPSKASTTAKNGAAKDAKDSKDQPIAKKLGLKTGQTMVMIDAPTGFTDELKLPTGIDLHTAARRGVEFDVAILFVPTNRMLTARLGPLSKSMKASGKLWIAFPKKGTMSTDLNDVEVKKIGSTIGLIEDKSAAFDKTWTGLSFSMPDKVGK